jgi:hypothetical protein
MGEHVDDITFLKVSFENNKEMCKTMGVKVGALLREVLRSPQCGLIRQE